MFILQKIFHEKSPSYRFQLFHKTITSMLQELLKATKSRVLRPDTINTINKRLKLLTRLQLGLSHLGDHKFRHHFQDCVSPMCYRGQSIEATTHFLQQFSSDSTITKILLFGDNKLDFETNKILLCLQSTLFCKQTDSVVLLF